MGEEEIKGYIHDVSHLGTGESKTFFNFQLQTESETIRGVCFSPGKKRSFEQLAMKKSPIKLKKFIRDKKKDSTDILMNEKVVVEELSPSDIQFEHRETVSQEDLDIMKLSNILPEQLVTLKAKVINLQKQEEINTNTGAVLTKREALLLDPSGTIKIVLWEHDVTAISEGKTYQFKNLRLKKNKVTNETYVNPAKGISVISETEGFPVDALNPPQQIPDELIRASFTGEIAGVQKCVLNLLCLKCFKVIKGEKSRLSPATIAS
eukprot:gene1490-1649_t